MFKLVLKKAEEPEIKLPTSAGSLKKQESSRKSSISALLTMSKPLTVWITINYVPGASERNSAHGKSHEEGGLAYAKVWSSLRKPPVPEHLTPKPESVLCSHLHLWLYGGLSPITVSLRKGVRQGCILSPCLFNFYAEYIMRNPGLEEAQARIKIAGAKKLRLLGEISITSDMQMTPPLWQKVKRN